MKPSNLSNFLGAGVLALGLATLPAVLPASAQSSGTDTGTTTTAPSSTNSQGDYRQERHNDYGWLGLLGLIGLAGLRRKSEPAATYRDPSYQDPNVGVRR